MFLYIRTNEWLEQYNIVKIGVVINGSIKNRMSVYKTSEIKQCKLLKFNY